jgi:hypothetical protein
MEHEGVVAIITAVLSGIGILSVKLVKAYVIYLKAKSEVESNTDDDE